VIVVNGQNGGRYELSPSSGRALMWELRKMKVGVLGLCNGNAACGTCHVFVGPEWAARLPEPDEYEDEMLGDLSRRTEFSRLSCQLEYGPGLDGLELTVAPRD
jgi:ferredoxin, 2Fe-2S